ncbi:MAG: gephyrin-like molybdotransferase Glp [bacterium]
MMSAEFLDTSSLENAHSVINRHIPLGISSETLPLRAALGRITSNELTAQEDLPQFSKSTVDGFAVRASDTFGASEGTPIFMEVVGEVIMGTGEVMDIKGNRLFVSPEKISISDYTAIRIPTGGMLPEGSDGVVMIEYTQPCCNNKDKGNMIEVTRDIAPGENVIRAGEDIRKGESLFPKGHQIRTQDIGVLAGLGMTQVQVYRRPRIAILSTGPEICPIDKKPKNAQVRDINSYTLAAIVWESGGDPIFMGICPDNLDHIKDAVQSVLKSSDCVLISGGSSVGSRDYTFQAITQLGPPGVLIHGLSIRPGKPTIIGQSGSVPIIGLPGHPASAMIVAQTIVSPLVHRLSGLSLSPLEAKIRNLTGKIWARLTRNVPSPTGKEDFVRVALSLDQKQNGIILATPLFGKSGLISTLVKAHGILRIPADSEGAYEGEEVEILPF